MYTADDATSWHLQTDLAIVGASGGGLLAAIAAVRRGCRVVLLERTKDLGGNLARGPGIVPAAGTRFQRAAGIQDSPEMFANDIQAQNPRPSDPALTLTLCRAAAELVDWLVDEGITRLELVSRLVATGHVAPRLHTHATGTGAELSADLIRAVGKGSHISVRTGSVVEDVWANETGDVVGIAAREKRGPINISASRVLLACGGFGADAELVNQHQKAAADVSYAGVPGALGDGLRWGIACGAATQHLDACWMTPFCVAPGGFVLPNSLVRDGAVLVNQSGRRFVNETEDPVALAHAIVAQPGKFAYLILDDRIYRATREVDPNFARLIVPRAVRRGTNIADLARHFEIDPDNLETTLESFHPQTVHHADPFGRPPVSTALAPPFYGVRVTAARMRTLGGLCVDGSAQVLRVDGSPVKNLYAAGGVVSDISGEGRQGYPLGHDVLMSLTLGWLVGRSAQPREPE